MNERKKLHRLTEKEVEEMYEIFRSHSKDFTIEEIAEMYNISPSTVNFRKRKFAEMIEDEKLNKEEKSIDEIAEKKTDTKKNVITVQFNPDIEFNRFHRIFMLDKFQCDLKEYKGINSEYIEVGLIADRHPLPVKMFIFDKSFDNELMFDYHKQEEIVQHFIDTHCKFKRKIILYTTGMQSALTSVIKVCANNEIDIHIKHYNVDTGTYQLQPVFGDLTNIKPDTFEKLAKSKGGLFFYKCSQEEMNNYNKEFYVIKFANKSSRAEGHIIAKSFKDAYEIVPSMIESMLHYDSELALYVNKAYIKDDKFVFGLCFSKNYNTKFTITDN